MATMVEMVVGSVRTLQAALLIVAAGLQLTGYMWPPSATVANGAAYDIIIVGSGTAGSILANRLTEEALNVLLIEAGGDPPLESVLPGTFPVQVLTANDYNYTSENDGYTSQNMRDNVAWLTAGKMLGGTSSMNHMNYIRGVPNDYAKWAEVAGDESWNYWNLLPYFIKTEKLEDPDILATPGAQYHGTNGYLRLTRQTSEATAPLLAAYSELGINNVLNLNTPSFTVGVAEPMLTIADGLRQSAAEAYLRPLADRPNFSLLKNTQVTKVLFDDNKTATGVEALTADGTTITINANLEVILSAGVFNTPKLLMLSGVGPSESLSSFGIPVISDLPVGQNLQDHIPAVVMHTLAPGEPVTAPADPHAFPAPIAIGYSALNLNQAYPDYQSINLVFPADHPGSIQICSLVFGFKNEICQSFFDGGSGQSTLFTVHSIVRPFSRGEVLLRSTDPADAPVVHHGIYTDETDLENMALYLEDFARIVNTTTFRNMGAAIIDLDLPECNDLERNTHEHWKCYALATSGGMWAWVGTSAMGSVLDRNLLVKGVQRLRVVDASAIPSAISGNTNAAVTVLAERAADIVKATYGASPRS